LLINPFAVTASLAPFVREVPDKTPTVEWNAAPGTVFPTSNYFSWKSGGPGGGTIPTRVSSTQLSLSYSQSASSTWTYAITLETAVGGVKVTVDPEIHNDPPVP
jgi:hypothetical protein